MQQMLDFRQNVIWNLASYLIDEFKEMMIANILSGKNKTLASIFDEIQNKLYDMGKQQTTNLFNNRTRHYDLKQTPNLLISQQSFYTLLN